MVIDTSALVAILQGEPECKDFARAIEHAEDCTMSAVTFVEVSMVIGARFGPDGLRDLDLLISKARIKIASVGEGQAQIARQAFMRYGKGRHRAGLNFGDCFAYALATERGERLLCKGLDFVRTDVSTTGELAD